MAPRRGPPRDCSGAPRYVTALLELSPDRDDRVAQSVTRVIGDLDPAPETFHGRNRVVLERLGDALLQWDSGHAHDAVVRDAVRVEGAGVPSTKGTL